MADQRVSPVDQDGIRPPLARLVKNSKRRRAPTLSSSDGMSSLAGASTGSDKQPGRKVSPRKMMTMPSTTMKTTTKLSSGDSDDAGEEAGKRRTRGRPRIDVTDVTAADRRRTQIRLAQRAYRNRKEKVIFSLEKRVQTLAEANEAMSHAFMSLHDFAVSRGLVDDYPEFALQLRSTTETFLELARQSSGAEDDDDDDDEAGALASSNGDHGDMAATLTASTTATAATTARNLFDEEQRRIAAAVKTFSMPPPPFQAYPTSSSGGSSRRRSPIDEAMVASSASTSAAFVDGSRANPGPLYESVMPVAFSEQMLALFGDGESSSSFRSSISINSSRSGSSNSNSGMEPAAAMYASSGTALSPFFSAPTDVAQSSHLALGHAVHQQQQQQQQQQHQRQQQQQQQHQLQRHQRQKHQPVRMAPFPSSGIASESIITLPSDWMLHRSQSCLEPNFSLRLCRRAFEEGYVLTANAQIMPEKFTQVFGFCTVLETVEQISARMRAGIDAPGAAPPSSPLSWYLPYVTKVTDPAVLPKHVRGHHPTAEQLPDGFDPSTYVSYPGFEDVYFDHAETDTYLRRRGVIIPPNTDRVIVEVDAADFGGAVVADEDALPLGPLDPMRAYRRLDGGHHEGSDSGSGSGSRGSMDDGSRNMDGSRGGLGFDTTTDFSPYAALSQDSRDSISAHSSPFSWPGGDTATTTAMTTASQDNSGLAATLMGSATLFSQDPMASSFSATAGAGAVSTDYSNVLLATGTQQHPRAMALRQKKVMTLDVEQFTQELVHKSICLGYTPGFRPADVNMAFWKAARSVSAH